MAIAANEFLNWSTQNQRAARGATTAQAQGRMDRVEAALLAAEKRDARELKSVLRGIARIFRGRPAYRSGNAALLRRAAGA